MSSSSAILPEQYWNGAEGFRDASDLILFKKRQGILQMKPSGVRPDITQSLTNTLSYRFAGMDCVCPTGQFLNVSIPYPAYPNA